MVETEKKNFTRSNIGEFFDGYKEHNMAMMVEDTKVITSIVIIIVTFTSTIFNIFGSIAIIITTIPVIIIISKVLRWIQEAKGKMMANETQGFT